MTDSAAPITLTIREWHDPRLSQRGLRADGNHATLVWGGLIGPTATVLLRLFGQLSTHGRSVEITDQELAATIGVAPSVVHRGIDRLSRLASSSVTATPSRCVTMST